MVTLNALRVGAGRGQHQARISAESR
jgi:hypothetical protein